MRALTVFGTRPEAIKMAPVVRALEEAADVESLLCVTGQHKHLLDQILNIWELDPMVNLRVMVENQSLPDLTTRVVKGVSEVLGELKPDVVLVHGDTTTSFATALAAFYSGIPVAHVEAGLRTHDVRSPFPEELNRQLTGRIARWNFAPTEEALTNLQLEGIAADRIHLVGNTIVESLLQTCERITRNKKLQDEFNRRVGSLLGDDWMKRQTVIVTAHRRENLGRPLEFICDAVYELSSSFPEVDFVYPLHPNPQISDVAEKHLKGLTNVKMIAPLSYPEFVWLLNACRFVLTDSGGVQEEAPILGKPVLLMRSVTERPEGVEAGVVELVGWRKEAIVQAASDLLTDASKFKQMSRKVALLGDGTTASQIVEVLRASFADVSSN